MTETGSMDRATLAWLDAQADVMRALVERLANVNSGTFNVAGVAKVVDLVSDAFSPLGTDAERLTVDAVEQIDASGRVTQRELGPALRLRKRPNAPLQVLLSAHLDTVFSADHSFQSCRAGDNGTLCGPGVADIKGGIVVMLYALSAFERSPLATNVGWEVLLNPDEEIGSPGSRSLLDAAAQRHDLGLVFEPTLTDGSMVSTRKGSGNFTIVLRGQSAHVGREFSRGRNAIHAACELVTQLDALNGRFPGVNVNVAKLDGGGPVNVVPDLAIVRLNARVDDRRAQQAFEDALKRQVEAINRREGYSAVIHGTFHAPPKVIDDAAQRLITRVTECGRSLGLTMTWKATGGVCDGNKLAAAGLPNVDTMGVRGGGIHSSDEFVVLESLPERAKLAASVLLSVAAEPERWRRPR